MAAAIIALPSPDARKTQLVDGLRQGTISPDEVVSKLVEESVLVGTAKPLLQAMANYAADDDCDSPKATTICNSIVKQCTKRHGAFAEEVLRAREVLADIYEGGQDYMRALAELLALPVDAALRSGTDEYKSDLYVRIADLSLDVDNTNQAETYVKRAWPLMKAVTDENKINRFDTCQAKLYEVQRKFLDAALKYYALSHKLEDGVRTLRLAILCCVLEPAGPKRSRLLATMYRDERSVDCGELGAILSKVHHERVLRNKDIAALAPMLQPYHKAIMSNGRTCFENAIIQHNLLSASKLYFNIRFNELGVLLGVDPASAEKIAAQMVAEDRLQATIDQVDEVILFTADKQSLVQQWDSQIDAACNGICSVAADITRRYPTALSATPTV